MSRFHTLLIAVILSGSLVAHAEKQQQYSKVYSPVGCVVDIDCHVSGYSNIVRVEERVRLAIFLAELTPNAAYTIWWRVFNNPEYCAETGCSDSDLQNPDVNGTVIWASGFFADDDGALLLSALLNEGDTSMDQPLDLPGNDAGLVDAYKAEIHVVVRSHGQPLSLGRAYEQIRSFDGGCGVNICEDQYYAVFK